MNYELAKKLKDAGFPQENNNGIFLEKDGKVAWGNSSRTAYAPTLPELILACGKSFYQLIQPINGKWKWSAVARRYGGKKGGVGHSEFSPEIAVANLWLALNQTSLT